MKTYLIESQIEILDRALEITGKMLSRQGEIFESRAMRDKGKQYGSMAWLRVKDQGGEITLDRLVAEQLKIDNELIDRAIAKASENAEIEFKNLRFLHKSQLQLLEAQQQSRRIKNLYRKIKRSPKPIYQRRERRSR